MENIPNTISASKEKNSSIKPDAKTNREVTCKDKDDQTSIKQFTKTQISTEKQDLQSIVSQLALITENKASVASWKVMSARRYSPVT